MRTVSVTAELRHRQVRRAEAEEDHRDAVANRPQRENGRYRRLCEGRRDCPGDDDDDDEDVRDCDAGMRHGRAQARVQNSTAPPTSTVVATMTMTYVRSDALCSAGAMVRLTAVSIVSALDILGSMPRVATSASERLRAPRTPSPTAASVSTLSSSAGVTPCQTAQRDIDRHAGDRGRRSRERSVED